MNSLTLFRSRALHARHTVRLGSMLLALAWIAWPPPLAHAATYFVAPNGNDTNPGTQERPFATLGKSQASAGPGDTVFIRGGVYNIASGSAVDGILLDKSGQTGKRINYWAFEREKPVFDFSRLTAKQRLTGIRVSASWVHLKGLELKGVPQRINTANESWGVYNLGSNNIYDTLDIHHISGPGLFIGNGSNNVVVNCDSHENYDPLSKAGAGENADGFGCHGSGTNNIFRGCRAWWNTDDGYDFISAKGICIVEQSWAFYNGYMPGTFEGKKNGNGFKAGGYGTGTVPPNVPRHTVRRCLAFRNRAAGFYANHHPIGGDWFHNTGYKNARDFDMLVSEGGNPNHVLRNNLGYASNQSVANYTGTNARNNSWQLNLSINDSDFQSVDLRGVDGPRQSDGSLPNLPFMKLRAGSDLIDRGNDIGEKFSGSAPDLGAFESGITTAALRITGSLYETDETDNTTPEPWSADLELDSNVDVETDPSDHPLSAPESKIDDDSGCRAGGRGENHAGTLLITLLLFITRRRRKT